MPTTSRKDPNVKIPTAVARGAAQAEAAFHAANGTQPADPASTPDPAPTPDPTPTPDPAPAPVTPEGNAPQNWEHAYKSMKGRHDAAQNSIRELSERVQVLTKLIETTPPAPPADTPAEMQAASLLTPEETNEYGAEFLDVVGRRAVEQLSPELTALKKELGDMRAQLGNTAKTTAENARSAMNTALDQQLPTWRQVNVSPEFHEWLALPDLFSGAIRHSLLTAAYEQNDTPRVLAFFKGFLANEAALAPAVAEPDTTVSETGKIPLETFAAPGRAKTAAASGAPVEKPTFTRAQVATFFADVAAGKYRGREADKERIDSQIVEAGREGRIR